MPFRGVSCIEPPEGGVLLREMSRGLSMKRLMLMMTLIAVVSTMGEAQTYQRKARTKILNPAVNAGTYSFDIWARNDSAGTTFFVGISSLFFTYNSSALANPTLTNVNPKYTGTAGVDNYDPMTVAIVSGKIAVTIRWTGNATGGGSQLATASPDTNGERICTVNLQITNPSQTSQLSWDMVNSAVLTTGTFSVNQTFLGSDNGPLPVQLASFSARTNAQGHVRLEWRTLSEINNYGFYVQKSPDRNTYGTISPLIPGHGTTNEPHSYTWTDVNAQSGRWYYRLKQVDLDGAEHFSEAIVPTGPTHVDERPLPTEFTMGQNFPNPFNPSTTIEIALPKESHVRLEVFNLLGQRVALLLDNLMQAGYHTVTFEGRSFSSGLYFYRMTASGNKVFLRKMLLAK